jgi:hypothetical protein
MADVQEEEAAGEERDVVIIETETAIMAATETESDAGALAPNDCSVPAQLRNVIPVDGCGTGEGSQTQRARSVFARATQRKRNYCYQPLGIHNEIKDTSLDGDRKKGQLAC